MLGVRVTFNTPETPAWLKDGTADWFWPAAEKAGLPVMFLAFGLVNLFEPIAQRHPELPLIVDHMGVNTAIAQKGQMAEMIGHTVALAKYPNVSVKLSNLPNSSLEPYPYKDLTPAHQARVRRLRAAALPLGNRRDQRTAPGEVAPAPHPFHRDDRLHVGERQGLGARPLDPAEAQMGVKCARGDGIRHTKKSLTSPHMAAFAC